MSARKHRGNDGHGVSPYGNHLSGRGFVRKLTKECEEWDVDSIRIVLIIKIISCRGGDGGFII